MTAKTKLLLFILSLCFSLPGVAQTINTDRPDQSDGVSTVGKHRFQIEEGVTLAKDVALNNLMLRYGITNSTEVRLEIDAGKAGNAQGLAPVTLSAKQQLLQENNWMPAVTLVGYLSFHQLASPDFKSSHIPYEIKLAFENSLSDRLALGYNIGAGDDFESMQVSAGLGYSLSDKLSTFVEYFGSYATRKPKHNIDAGLLYLIEDNLQVDLALGHGLNSGHDHRFYTTFGIAYLFL